VESKVSLKEWRDKLSKYYSDMAIRKYYYEHKGSTKILSNLLLKKLKEHRHNSIPNTIERNKFKGNYNSGKSFINEDGRITIILNTRNKKDTIFYKFIKNELSKYFTDKGIGFNNEEKLKKLEVILKDYYDESHKIKELKEFIKKDSNSEREKEIIKILKKTHKLLEIIESDLCNTLPKEIKIKTIGELDKSTIEKLRDLNLQRIASTYSELLQAIRNI